MNKKCQVFTPQDYVEKLLDSIDYSHNIIGKSIMENSCGDGNILAVVVQRYIDDCRLEGCSVDEIKEGLNRDVHGVEIDPFQFKRCLEKLDDVAGKKGITGVEWDITNEDYLKISDNDKYDYIVGNPPYITYSELKSKEQAYLREHFGSCQKGKFDYCYAFLEKSVFSLKDDGKMAYLIPSSVFKTVFGDSIRNVILPFVENIIDYTQEKVFEEALVKSSIVVINKAVCSDSIHYLDDTTGTERKLERDSLGKKWNFVNNNVGNHRFGDHFKVSHAVATLCNKAFILKEWNENENGNFVCDDYVIESKVVRNAVSPKNMRLNHSEKIIFPYDYDMNHRLVRYSEDEFIRKFPGACEYLEHYRDDLEKRDSDKSAAWYEYGRSQALNGLNYEKALISTIISNEVLVYKLDSSSIPYAGMYIVPIGDQFDIDDGIDILKQDEFIQYAKSIGIPINGNSVRVTSIDVEDYLF